MADFFDRLLAKTAPVPRTTEAGGVKSVAAQPRLPHPFERPTAVGDLDWDEQAPAESDHSRRGNAMELRSEPTFGTRTAVSAVRRSEERVVFRSRPEARSAGDSGLRPLIVSSAAAELPLPRSASPTLPLAASQSPSRLTAPRATAGSAGTASILGSPTDRAPAAALPVTRGASPRPAPSPLARPAERGAPPAQRAAAAPQQPSVTVRIGRLEVRAAPAPDPRPTASRPERRTREPALKLDAYLAREGGRR